MKKTWKHTAILTLILIGAIQVLPFIPAHSNCQSSCCATSVSCCETEAKTKCEMAMTSCNVSMFIPLISAPLIKVESNIQLDIAQAPQESDIIMTDRHPADLLLSESSPEAPPPDKTPLLI